jgi:hypothetical protein
MNVVVATTASVPSFMRTRKSTVCSPGATPSSPSDALHCAPTFGATTNAIGMVSCVDRSRARG